MLIFSLRFIPAVLLGFLAGSTAFGRVSEELFRRLTLGITLAAGAFLLWSTWGQIETLNYTHTYPSRVQVTDIAIAPNPL